MAKFSGVFLYSQVFSCEFCEFFKNTYFHCILWKLKRSTVFSPVAKRYSLVEDYIIVLINPKILYVSQTSQKLQLELIYSSGEKQQNILTVSCRLVDGDWWFSLSEAATEGVLKNNLFLKISQNTQKSNCVWVSFLIKLQALCLQLY